MRIAVALIVVVATYVAPADLRSQERERVIAAADRYLTRPPQTITAFRAARSAGGPHDFFSEGDYWWPDPQNPDGPYIRRDGESNPDMVRDFTMKSFKHLFRACPRWIGPLA